MKLESIKSILSDNLEVIKTKKLRINEKDFLCLKSFELAILELEKEDRIWSLELCVGNHRLNFNTESSINHIMKRNFDTVKVYASIKRPYISLRPTEKAIKEFGTNV